jgi:hypothetical protein
MVLMLLATTADAHELTAPTVVTADGDGHFSYDITLEITSPIEFAYIDFDGSNNTDQGHWHADGFCMQLVEPGIYISTVEGNLLDPTQDGSVTYAHAMCDGWTGLVTTTIEAPAVATTAVSWSSLKAIFR